MSESDGPATNEQASSATGPGAIGSGPAAVPHLPLPRRPPKSLATHILIDGIVAAIVIGIPGFIAGVPLWALISVGGFIGIFAAPWTRRAEVRALAKRPKLSELQGPGVTRAGRPVIIDPASTGSADPPRGDRAG